MNEVIKTIAEQIDWRELHLANFNMGYDNQNDSLTIKKGKKFMTIRYNSGMDTYIVESGNWNTNFEITSETDTNVYFDQLKPLIETHFTGFEYIMEGLLNA